MGEGYKDVRSLFCVTGSRMLQLLKRDPKYADMVRLWEDRLQCVDNRPISSEPWINYEEMVESLRELRCMMIHLLYEWNESTNDTWVRQTLAFITYGGAVPDFDQFGNLSVLPTIEFNKEVAKTHSKVSGALGGRRPVDEKEVRAFVLDLCLSPKSECDEKRIYEQLNSMEGFKEALGIMKLCGIGTTSNSEEAETLLMQTSLIMKPSFVVTQEEMEALGRINDQMRLLNRMIGNKNYTRGQKKKAFEQIANAVRYSDGFFHEMVYNKAIMCISRYAKNEPQTAKDLTDILCQNNKILSMKVMMDANLKQFDGLWKDLEINKRLVLQCDSRDYCNLRIMAVKKGNYTLDDQIDYLREAIIRDPAEASEAYDEIIDRLDKRYPTDDNRRSERIKKLRDATPKYAARLHSNL